MYNYNKMKIKNLFKLSWLVLVTMLLSFDIWVRAENREFWQISIWDPANPWSWLTIMDRNLGATEVYNGSRMNINTGSYWYYYQWWNNYYFMKRQLTGNTY